MAASHRRGLAARSPRTSWSRGAAGARTECQDIDPSAELASIAVSKIFALTATNRVALRDLFDLHVLIEANVEDPSSALSMVPNAASRIGASREELWPKIEMMTYKQFRQEVIPFLPTATANAIDEPTFEDLRMSVWERVDRWLKDAADKLEGQDQI